MLDLVRMRSNQACFIFKFYFLCKDDTQSMTGVRRVKLLPTLKLFEWLRTSALSWWSPLIRIGLET